MKYILAFALVLLMSSAAMGVEVVMTASGAADDLFYDYDGADTFTPYERDSLIVGYRASTSRFYGFGITFDRVLIPQDATITSCVLRVKTKRAFSVVDLGTSYTIAFNLLPHETAPNAGNWYAGNSPGYGGQSATIATNTEFDINCGTTSLQNTVGLDTWAYGNSVTVYVADDAASDSYLILQSVQTFAHTLTVNYTYTPPSSGRQAYRVVASADDCTDDGSGTYLTEAYTYFETGYDNGFRFQNIQVPQGSVIDTAIIENMPYDLANNGTIVNMRITGDDTDDAATFSDHTNFAARTRTTAQTDWSAIPTWTYGTRQDTPNFKTVFQEIVDRPGYAAGSDAAFFIKNNASTGGSRHSYCYDGDPLRALVFRVTYSAPSSGTTPSARRRKMMLGACDELFPIWGEWEAVQ